MANIKWKMIGARDAGWFFSEDDEKLVFCPEHLPAWVNEWRQKCQKAK